MTDRTSNRAAVAKGTPSATPPTGQRSTLQPSDKRPSQNRRTNANVVRRSWRIGYARVSSSDQNPARQIDALADVDEMHLDRASGRTRTARPGLEKLLTSLRPGDTVVVPSLDRLARSVRDACDIVDEIEAAGATLQILDLAVDTASPMGRFMLQLFASVAELERSQIRNRQAEGIAAAKARGTHLGRPRALSPSQIAAVRQLRSSGVSFRALAQTFGVSSRTIERAAKGSNVEDPPPLG